MASRAARKPYSRPPPPKRNANDQWVHDMADDAPRPPVIKSSIGSSVPNAKLVVSNLHYEITPQDLTAIFGQIGTLVSEPRIRYDRSGRSSGTAIVAFESVAEATRAKNQYDGILAKGQPMTVAFDASLVRGRSVSAPTTSSLLSRIQKGPLLGRLGGSKDDSAIKSSPAARGGVGPIRTRARGGNANARTAPAPRPRPPKNKTAEELDKELDAFMGDSTPTNGDAATAPATAAAAVPPQDVEMA